MTSKFKITTLVHTVRKSILHTQLQ